MRLQEEEKRERKIAYTPEEEKTEKECPSCGKLNDYEAEFCGECGHCFGTVRKCPKCGAKVVSSDADICEVCGEWLLEGKCKFCYADIEEGAIYCAECGNPVAGVICPQCGRISYFDFCKYCDIPLTGAAQDIIKKMQDTSQEQKEIFNSNQEARRFYMAQKFIMNMQNIQFVQKDESNDIHDLKSYLKKIENKGEKRKTYTPLFSQKQKESIKKIDEVANKEIERQEEEKRRRLEEERRKREEERKRHSGWRCNAYGVVHLNGPSGCSAPSRGGHWV